MEKEDSAGVVFRYSNLTVNVIGKSVESRRTGTRRRKLQPAIVRCQAESSGRPLPPCLFYITPNFRPVSSVPEALAGEMPVAALCRRELVNRSAVLLLPGAGSRQTLQERYIIL